MKIGARIYYEIETGNVIIDKRERQGSVVPTTVEHDINTYKALSERNRETFDYIDLEYGQYAQDFAECNGYRVNPLTRELEFSYPDPNEPEAPIEFRQPLSVEVESLKEANENLVAANEILTESLIDFKIAYMSVPCQSHQDYPVIIENLIEGATKDGE